MPGLGVQSYYAGQSAALNVYETNLPDFAPAMVTTPQRLTSNNDVPFTGRKINSAYVNRIERMDGIQAVYGHGAVNMGEETKGPRSVDSGAVNSTMYQPLLSQIHYYSKNLKWYIAYPNAGAVFYGGNPIRQEYFSMRVPQITTSVTGGPGPHTQRMQPKPRFTSVQTIRRAYGRVKFYATESAGGVLRSNVNASSPTGVVNG